MNPRYEMYCIETFTGRAVKTPRNGTIMVTLHGATNSERIPLSQTAQEKGNALFHKQSVDSFYVVIPEVIGLSGITFHYTGARHSWNLEFAVVKVGGRSYKAEFHSKIKHEQYQQLTLIVDHTIPYLQGRIQLGPLLKFRGIHNNSWCVSAMVVTDNVPMMPGPLLFSVSGVASEFASLPPVCYYQQYNNQLWRFDFEIPVVDVERTCTYRLPMTNKEYSFHIPAVNQKPAILFCSCNDRAHPYNMSPNESIHKSIGWKYMLQQMNASKYHLLIMGGDQIYADSLFSACESVRIWDNMPKEEKWTNSAKYFSNKTVEELNCFYFNMYLFCWGYQATVEATASVPTTMMYDDHDIYDGWGSLDPHINDSDMMINIFKVAKKFFFLFQMSGDLSSVINEPIVLEDPEPRKAKETPPFECFGVPQHLNDQGPFNIALNMTGGVSVVLLDLRTERRMFTHDDGIIMRENSYRNFEKFLTYRAALAQQQHMFVVCTVPIHYPDADMLNKLMDITHHELIDDVRDHYSATIHRNEQSRVLNDLAAFCGTAAPGSRATILSGDVHLACFTSADIYLRNENNRRITIEQYISSGIAAKPPPLFAQRMMRTPLFRNRDRISTEYSEIFQTMRRLPTGKYYFRSQNFLCLNPLADTYNAMWIGCPELKKQNKQLYIETNPLPPPISFSRNIAPSNNA